jgi:hypothetical protein
MSLILVAIADLAIVAYIGCLLVFLMRPDAALARERISPVRQAGTAVPARQTAVDESTTRQ